MIILKGLEIMSLVACRRNFTVEPPELSPAQNKDHFPAIPNYILAASENRPLPLPQLRQVYNSPRCGHNSESLLHVLM